MTAIDRLVGNALDYPGSYPAPPSPVPATGVAVVACMDARINMFALLNLAEGDAHVIRNAGGSVTDDTIRSLVMSQR